jgi:hypothetical protein
MDGGLVPFLKIVRFRMFDKIYRANSLLHKNCLPKCTGENITFANTFSGKFFVEIGEVKKEFTFFSQRCPKFYA